MTSSRIPGPGSRGPIAPPSRAAPPSINIPPAAAPAPAAPFRSLPGAQAQAPPQMHIQQAEVPPSHPLPAAPAQIHVPVATPVEAGSGNIDMPPQLRDKLISIQEWAKKNQQESQFETFLFWCLKVPVIVASAGAAVFVKFNFDLLVIVLGAVSAACVLIDGLARPGALRNYHHKAYFELTTLVDDIYTKSQRGTLDPHNNNNNNRSALAEKLFDQIIAKSAEISAYLVDAETIDKGPTKRQTSGKP